MGEAEAYGVCSALIKTEEKNQNEIGLGALEKSHVLKRLLPETGFALAIKALRAGDAKAFETFAFTMQREHPLHPDLTVFKTSEEETLGHLAARWDQAEIVKVIAKKNSDSLEICGKNGDTVAHTASRFCSGKTIDALVRLKPELFGRRNLSGERPLDLAGGKLIQTKIDLEQIQKAEDKSGREKERARNILIAAAKKKPGTPLIRIQNGRLKMERVSPSDRVF